MASDMSVAVAVRAWSAGAIGKNRQWPVAAPHRADAIIAVDRRCIHPDIVVPEPALERMPELAGSPLLLLCRRLVASRAHQVGHRAARRVYVCLHLAQRHG
jgi:hypothetical protein